jgi:hypothetical protein
MTACVLPHVRQVWGNQPDAAGAQCAQRVREEQQTRQMPVRISQLRNDSHVLALNLVEQAPIDLAVGKTSTLQPAGSSAEHCRSISTMGGCAFTQVSA